MLQKIGVLDNAGHLYDAWVLEKAAAFQSRSVRVVRSVFTEPEMKKEKELCGGSMMGRLMMQGL